MTVMRSSQVTALLLQLLAEYGGDANEGHATSNVLQFRP